MNTSANSNEMLKGFIEEKTNLSNQLLIALEQEREALQTSDRIQVQAITKHKSELLKSLSALTDQLTTFANENLGLENPQLELKSWIKRQSSVELQQEWDTLAKTLEKNKSLNEMNGVLIKRASFKNEFLKKLLLMDEPTNSYDPKGKQSATRASHTLGKA